MNSTQIPTLTTNQMVEVDRLMIEEYGIILIQMMENAGRHLAALTRQKLGGRIDHQKISILCGAGNNGGGGLVSARHLSNWGADVTVILTHPIDKLKDIPLHQWKVLSQLPVQLDIYSDDHPPTLHLSYSIIDAMIGYGLHGNPKGTIAALIQLANESGKPIIALDAPSGLDTTKGLPGKPCINATATLTLALPKVGLMTDAAKTVVGELYLADISVPPSLYSQLRIDIPPLFSETSIIKV